MQTSGLSRCQAHISVWIVLLSALTIVHRFLCFYVVSPTNGIASCDTCETSAQTTLGWMGKPVIGFEPMPDGYKPPALPIELYRHAFLENSRALLRHKTPKCYQSACVQSRSLRTEFALFVLAPFTDKFFLMPCGYRISIWKTTDNRHTKAGIGTEGFEPSSSRI